MERSQIEAGNKLIAEFMGLYRPENEEHYEHFVLPKGREKYSFADTTNNVTDLKFQSSWDWQIEAWQHLVKTVKATFSESNRDDFKERFDFGKKREKYENYISSKTPLESFEVLVEALTWFNNQKKQK